MIDRDRLKQMLQNNHGKPDWVAIEVYEAIARMCKKQGHMNSILTSYQEIKRDLKLDYCRTTVYTKIKLLIEQGLIQCIRSELGAKALKTWKITLLGSSADEEGC